MEFYQKGSSKKYTYKYVGKHILTYKKGNRGVRYLLKRKRAMRETSNMFNLVTMKLLR